MDSVVRVTDNATPAASIRQAIRSKGLKVGWVAEQLQVSPGYLSSMLTGARVMSRDWVERIAVLLDVPVETFLGGDSNGSAS